MAAWEFSEPDSDHVSETSILDFGVVAGPREVDQLGGALPWPVAQHIATWQPSAVLKVCNLLRQILVADGEQRDILISEILNAVPTVSGTSEEKG